MRKSATEDRCNTKRYLALLCCHTLTSTVGYPPACAFPTPQLGGGGSRKPDTKSSIHSIQCNSSYPPIPVKFACFLGGFSLVRHPSLYTYARQRRLGKNTYFREIDYCTPSASPAHAVQHADQRFAPCLNARPRLANRSRRHYLVTTSSPFRTLSHPFPNTPATAQPELQHAPDAPVKRTEPKERAAVQTHQQSGTM